MKIGIITDIHSNIQALKAVLFEFDKEKVDKIICCGDIIGIGINPEEAVQALIQKNDILISVRGNHEQYLLKGFPKTVHDSKRELTDEELEVHRWNHKMLSAESKFFLGLMKEEEIVEIEGKTIYITHYPKKDEENYKKFVKSPDIEDDEELFDGINADIYLFGHTHTYSVNSKEGKWYINPGSLGCPEGNNIAKAGIIEIEAGKIDYKELIVKYNVSEIIDNINELKFPDYKLILEIFYGVK